MGTSKIGRLAPVLMALVISGLDVPVVFGQALQNVPGVTREEVQLGETQLRRLPEDADAGTAAITTDEAEAGTPLTPNSTFSFPLRGLRIEGLTVYDPEDLADIYASFIDTDVTIGGLREIGDRIERHYREDGYVATRVIIPPQAIRDGVPTLEVFEGKIIHYEVNGEIGEVKKQIARLLDNLLTDKPARIADLERYLLLARDLPGISLTGTLRPAGDSAPGGVILVVDAARKAVDAFVNFENRNAEPTGSFTLSAGTALNSNTEYAEKIGAVALLALEVPEQVTGFASYEQSIGSEGLVARLTGTQGFSEPKDQLRDLELSTLTTVINLEAEYPLVRSREISVWSRGGLEYVNQRTENRNSELFHDQFLTMQAGVRGIWQHPLGGTAELDIEYRRGFGFIGSSGTRAGGSRSRTDADGVFNVLRGSAAVTQPLPPFFEVFTKAQGQVASDALPSFEEMSLGELTVGRGYEPGSLIGDSGLGITAEARFYPPGIDLWWLDSLQVYGFFDAARVYDRRQGNQPSVDEELYSAGFGVRFQMFETFFGNVYYAQPMTRALESADRRPESTVKFVLTKYF